MSVKKQLIGIYIIVVLIPVLIIGVYLTRLMCNMVVDRAINEANHNIQRIEDRLNETIDIANRVANGLYIDEKVKGILTTSFQSYGEVVQAYNDLEVIDEYLKNYEELMSIRIYTDNKTLLNNSQFMQTSNEIRKSKWYQEALVRSGKMKWEYKYDETTQTSYLCLIRALRDREYGLLGVLVININPGKLKNIIKEEPYGTVIAVNGQSIISGDEKLEKKVDRLRVKGRFDAGDYKVKLEDEDGMQYIIFDTFSPNKSQDTLVEVYMNMSVNSITQETMEIIKSSLLIVCVSTIISGILIFLFSKHFSERIILARKEMHRAVLGDFDIRPHIEGKDEISELYDDIYVTVQSVKMLVQENYMAKVQEETLMRCQKEMQFKMLTSQINPHFLYNTLETIRMKAYCVGETELANVVKMLSKLLRRSLEVGDHPVTLQSELALIRAYLDIQRFRFGERVSYEIKSEVDCNHYMILPFLIQPIIENAFIHGLEGKSGDGKIICEIKEDMESLQITVIDDGLGMDEKKLFQIIKQLTHKEQKEYDETGSSIGIHNVNERIKLYYGEEYGITIKSKVKVGTRVMLYLPKIQEE